MFDRKEIDKIAKERIEILFCLAEKELKKNPERAKRYVYLARKIAMKARVPISGYKKSFCRKCGSYLKLGVNAVKRISKSRQIITCLNCKNASRYPLTNKSKV